jgi:serine/threonine-protein kinase
VIKKKTSTSNGLEEARRLTSLEHRNIVNILGASKNDRFFIIVTEYLSGGSLEERLIQPLPIGEALKTAREICEGLAFAHENGVVHGSVRPGNLLFGDSGQAKLSDFGLDEHKDEKDGYALTREPDSVHADIFAAAVIFYQMLIGSLPDWDGDDLVPAESFLALPLEVQDLLGRMLMSKRAPLDVGLDEIVSEIDDLLEAYDKTAVLEVEPDPSTVERRTTRGKFVLLILLVVSMILGAVGGYFLYTGQVPIGVDDLVRMIEENF